MVAMDPTFTTQLNNIISFLHRDDLSMDAQQARYMANLPGEFQLFTTNFRSVFVELAWPWMTTLAKTFGGWADDLHGLQRWLHDHPGAEKSAGIAATGVAMTGTALGALMMTGLSAQLAGFAFGPVGRIMGALTGSAGFGGLVSVLGMVGRAALPLIGPAGTIAAIALALYELHQHSHDIARAIMVAKTGFNTRAGRWSRARSRASSIRWSIC